MVRRFDPPRHRNRNPIRSACPWAGTPTRNASHIPRSGLFLPRVTHRATDPLPRQAPPRAFPSSETAPTVPGRTSLDIAACRALLPATLSSCRLTLLLKHAFSTPSCKGLCSSRRKGTPLPSVLSRGNREIPLNATAARISRRPGRRGSPATRAGPESSPSRLHCQPPQRGCKKRLE
jgi:hypothetical protein